MLPQKTRTLPTWLSAQPASRLAFTAAIVDKGTIYIDDYRDVTFPTGTLVMTSLAAANHDAGADCPGLKPPR